MIVPSPFAGVTDDAWTQFVRAMATSDLRSVSDSNALGMFEISVRRLADMGVVTGIRRKRSDAGKMVWVGAFVPPMNHRKFLGSVTAQYAMFSRSMRDYQGRLDRGEIAKPEGVSTSGALAILHRAGPKGLEGWTRGKRFSHTQIAFERVNGVF